MIGNYLKIALNNFVRHQLFAVINIVGLAIGLASCLVIALYVRYELGFDQQYRNAERIIRVDQVVAGIPNFRTPGLLADSLITEVEGVEQAARFVNVETTLTYENRTFNESAFAYADARFVEMLDFEWLEGTPQQALTDPASVVLTRTLATKFFGNADPIGKVLQAGENSMRVTGVIADLPDDTHLRFSALGSMAMFAQGLRGIGFELDDWNSWFVTTYALLAPDVAVADIDAQLPQLAARHLQSRMSLELLPLTDVYMHAQAPMQLSPVGSLQQVLISSAVAVCILIIAIINFVNLATARASWRAVEVGLRKSIGASRGQLIGQFLGESVALVVCAMILGLMLVEVLLPIVSTVTGKELAFNLWTDPAAIASLLLGTFGLGIVAGCYPAFYLSAFRPIAVLKGEVTRGRRGSLLRSSLVVVQFSISIALIVAAAVIYLQIRNVRDIDMGFDYRQVVLLDVLSANVFDANTQWQSLHARLNDHPGVIDSTHSVASPLRQGSKTSAFIYREQDGTRVQSQDRFMLESVEPRYLFTYGLELLSGRWFSESLQSDRLATFEPGYEGSPQGTVILNEEAARRLGWSPAEAIGQVVGVGTTQRGTVAGVVRNTMVSLRQRYQPLIYFVPDVFDYRFGATIAVRIAGENVPQALDHIDATWKAFFPNNPVQRYFLQGQINALYQEETSQMQLSMLSAVLAVLLACFGLHALAAFNAEHRIKEIGIRKVMGGSVWSIVVLLTTNFSRLVLLSNLIAWPIAYFAMERWLQNFAYRIDLTPMIFIGSGLIALCIAWVTVGGTAAKAASAKPVLALRYE
jgi:putative ABC transport system permease protein